jgi:hypothetical protein
MLVCDGVVKIPKISFLVRDRHFRSNCLHSCLQSALFFASIVSSLSPHRRTCSSALRYSSLSWRSTLASIGRI